MIPSEFMCMNAYSYMYLKSGPMYIKYGHGGVHQSGCCEIDRHSFIHKKTCSHWFAAQNSCRTHESLKFWSRNNSRLHTWPFMRVMVRRLVSAVAAAAAGGHHQQASSNNESMPLCQSYPDHPLYTHTLTLPPLADEQFSHNHISSPLSIYVLLQHCIIFSIRTAKLKQFP